MRSHRALRKTWVRACVLIATAMVVVYGLSVVWMILVEDDHRTLGDAVGDLDFACLVAALFLGPVWVLHAFRPPTPPRNDGPPGAGGEPLPTDPWAGSDARYVVATGPIRPPTDVDDEIRALLDREPVSSTSR